MEALTLPARPARSEPAASLLPAPLDITEIGRRIVTGQYRTADTFDHDFRRLFTAQLRAHGRCSPVGAAVLRLKHKYAEFKTVMMSQIQEILGVTPSSFRPPAKRRQDCGLGQWSPALTTKHSPHYQLSTNRGVLFASMPILRGQPLTRGSKL